MFICFTHKYFDACAYPINLQFEERKKAFELMFHSKVLTLFSKKNFRSTGLISIL